MEYIILLIANIIIIGAIIESVVQSKVDKEIYGMSNKLSNTDVIEELIAMLEDEEKEVLRRVMLMITPDAAVITTSPNRSHTRVLICHGIMEGMYEFPESDNKKYMRQLVKKYISNTALREGELEGYNRLYVAIMDYDKEGEDE